MIAETINNNEFQTFSFELILLPTIAIMVIGYVISQNLLRNRFLAFSVAFIKAFLFFIYFYALYDGSYNSGSDDYLYIKKGEHLLIAIRNNSLTDLSIINVTETFHYSYIVVSAFAQYLFGGHYFSLVAINIIASIFCGFISYKIIVTHYSNARLAKLFYIATVMYPDVLAWSTVFAGKDIFVLLGHFLFIYAFALMLQGKRLKGTTLFATAFFYMINLRFYVPLIFVPLFLKFKRIWFLMFIGTILVVLSTDVFGAFTSLTNLGFASIINLDVSSLALMPVSVLQFWLTPRPFFAEPQYGFLLFPSLFTWITFPLMCYGLIKTLLSVDKFERFIALYFVSFTAFYVVADFLRGPRHRLQLTFALIFFLWVVFSKFRKNRRRTHLVVDE